MKLYSQEEYDIRDEKIPAINLLYFFVLLSAICVFLEVECYLMRGSWSQDWSFLVMGYIFILAGFLSWKVVERIDNLK